MSKIRHFLVKARASYLARASSLVDANHFFTCNICGSRNPIPASGFFEREAVNCRICHSTLRFRALMAALQERFAGAIKPFPQIPKMKSISGIGMSDASVYSEWLSEKFSYVNTFYHKHPHLDIHDPPASFAKSFDFVVSSDVFEHVTPPVELAFTNVRGLLKSGGVLVFTVPYVLSGCTKEHFPELHDYRIIGKGRDRKLINTTEDQRLQVFEDLCFHGGSGSTLEMRVFSLPSLLINLEMAGFRDIRVHDQDAKEWGLLNAGSSGAPISAVA